MTSTPNQPSTSAVPNALSSPKASEQLTRMLGYLEQDPCNIHLNYDLIDLCFRENQLDQAERTLTTATEYWPGEPGVLNRRAILALRRNNPQAAIVELDKILASGKADAPVRYNLGYASYLTGNFTKAREALEPALADADHLPGLAPLYVLSLQQLGENDSAIAFAEKHLDAHPEDAELQGVLALLYFDGEKDMAACRRYTEAALSKHPNHPMALVAASALSMMDEKPTMAVEFAQKVVRQNPSDGRAWSSLGLAQLYLMNLPEAELALQTAVRHMPYHIGTWHALAWAQMLQKDIDGAEASFNKARDIDRNFGETQGGLAVIAQLRGDKDRAKSLMDRAKRLAPAGMTLQYLKLLQLQEKGNNEAVQKYLEETLKRSPSFKGDTVLDMVRRMGRKNT